MRARNALLAAVATAAGVTGIMGGANASTQTNSEAPTSTRAAGAAVPEVQADIANNFAIFRDKPATSMPSAIAARVGSAARFGRNANLARSIATPYGPGWVIPGDQYVCITMPDPVDGFGESCAQTSVAVKEGVWLRLAGDSADAKAADVLLAPDGANVSSATPRQVSKRSLGVYTRAGATSEPPPTVDAG